MKLLALISILLFSFSLASCGDDKKKDCEKKDGHEWDADKKECKEKAST